MSKSENRTVVLTIVTGFTVLFLIYKKEFFIYTAVTISFASLISSYLTEIIVKSWLKLGHALGWINSRIILTAIYYLFLFPIALLSKISKKDVLEIKPSAKSSMFKNRNHQFKGEDFEKIW